MEKKYMDTLSVVLENLKAEGYRTQFKATEKGLLSLDTQRIFQAHEVRLENTYRFEGTSNPADSSILYALATSSGEKGTLVDSYGAVSDDAVTNFMKDVNDVSR